MALEYLKCLVTNRTQYDDLISIFLIRTIERLHVFLETNKKKLFNNTKVFCQLFDLSNLKETTKVKKVFNTKGVLLPWPKKTHSMLRTTMKDFVITQQCLMIRSDSFHREKVYSCGIRPIIFSLSNISFVEVKLEKKLFCAAMNFSAYRQLFCIPIYQFAHRKKVISQMNCCHIHYWIPFSCSCFMVKSFIKRLSRFAKSSLVSNRNLLKCIL